MLYAWKRTREPAQVQQKTKDTIIIDADISPKNVKATVNASGRVVWGVVLAILIFAIVAMIIKNWSKIHGHARRIFKRKKKTR